MNEFRSRVFGQKVSGEALLGSKAPRGDRASGGLTDVAVQRHETRSADSRIDDRHRLESITVTAEHRGKRTNVQLINLSGGGAMIAATLSPNITDRVDLDFGETGRIESVVRWVKNGRIGLEFAHETQIDCSPEQRSALLREVIERTFPEVALADRPSQPEPEAEDASATEGRRETRHPLIWSGTVRIKNHEAPVRIRNISSRGALIQSDITMYAGTLLLLDLGEAGSVAATVNWAAGDQAGLLFDSDFDIRQLAAAKPKVAPVEWMCPKYLQDAGKETAWEEAWGRATIDELASSLEGFLKR